MTVREFGRGRGRERDPEPPVVAGRVPPHDLDAEAAVLSSCMLDRDALDRVLETLEPEHFYSEANKLIFEACRNLSLEGTPIDVVSVASWLRSRETIQRVGGPKYLARLVDATPAVANVSHHARVVKEKWRIRRVISVCHKYAALGYGDVGLPQEFIDVAEQELYDIARTPETTTVHPLKDVLTTAFKQISAAAERGDQITGVPTRYVDLDKKTAGLHRGDLMIIAARPGMGKCLSADSEIVQHDGSITTIAEIFRRKHARLWTLGADWKLSVASPSHFVDDGLKPVFRVTTRLGRQVETTLSHPFLTMHGWRPLADLAVGERIAVPRELPAFGQRPLPEAEIKLLAYLLGDGGLTGGTAVFTNTNPRLLADFAEAASSIVGVSVRRTDRDDRAPSLAVTGDAAFVSDERPAFGRRLRQVMADRGITGRALAKTVEVSPAAVSQWLSGVCVPCGFRYEALCAALDLAPGDLTPNGHAAISKNARNPLVLRLEQLGLMGKGSAEKAIPEPVFTLPRTQLALFLNRLFATDGWATVLASGQAQLGYATVSERLARQIQHLLLRFGVIASLRHRMVAYRETRRPCFQLDITHAPSIRRFADEIGIFGKEEAVWAAVEAYTCKKEHADRDVIPSEVWAALREAKGTESQQLATSDVYWDEVVAIDPLGSKQVYDLTIPETHNFVADDICVHNTSFVLNMAVNVASPQSIIVPGPGHDGYGAQEAEKPGYGVAVFSLEMPKEQVAARLVCCEARVDLGKLRQGALTQDDWAQLTSAASMLANLPVWIDDSPGLGILELRAKVRRLQAEYTRAHGPDAPGLGAVIVDYLQLMQGRKGAQSREQEISEISRGLKQLAKELSVPVIALSQLNRGVETRAGKDKRPMLSDLRECVPGDTLVMLADGRRIPIAELVGQTPKVLAMDSGRIVTAESEAVWRVGEREIVEVRLASGRRFQATAKHRVYGARGWARVGELAVGDRLATARTLPEPREPITWHDDLVALLGQLIGDGSYLAGQPLRYTSASEDNLALVERAARDQLGCEVKRYAGRGQWSQLLLSGNGNRWRPAGVNRWLRDLGVFGQRSHEKRIPREAFRLSNRQVAILLRHLWATDGTIYVAPKNVRTGNKIAFSSNSRRLAEDVMALLLRLGVVTRVYEVAQGRHRPMFSVVVSGADHQRRFLEEVGAFGPRVAPARTLRAALDKTVGCTNADTLPREIFEQVGTTMRSRGITTRAMATLRGTAYGGAAHFTFAPSRSTVADYAELLDDPELASAASSDLFWDRVVAVEPVGQREVYDLTVPGPASWLADGVVSHNSGAIEQDADIIIFIYRDEYYNHETTTEHGIAELIVAKQRNGPTGTVRVRFVKSCTRFENLAPGEYEDFEDFG